MKALRTWCVCAILFASVSCGGGDRGRIVFALSLSGLQPIPAQQGWYEGFAVGNDGFVRSTGKFNLDPAFSPPRVFTPRGDVLGTTTSATFGPANTFLGTAFPFIYDATAFFITIEPFSDVDGVPTGPAVMGGPISGTSAVLSQAGIPSGFAAGLPDLSTATGTAVLTTPTDSGVGDAFGLWFTTDATGATPSLALPALTGAGTYEAFVSPDGTSFVSIGRFKNAASFDHDFMSHLGRGPDGVGFVAPGQDFTTAFTDSRPSPIDVADGGNRVEITVEPALDNSLGGFPLVVLSANVATTAVGANGVGSSDQTLQSGFAALPVYDLAATATSATLTATGGALGSLGAERDGRYELFAVIGWTPQSCGVFVIQASTANATSPNGATVFGPATAFTLSAANTGLGAAFPDLTQATEYFVSIEPHNDPVPGNSGVVLLAGADVGGGGVLTVAGLSATGGRGLADFSTATGSFILRTPTNDAPGVAADDRFGVWFRTATTSFPSLFLPALPSGWTYEGWVVRNSDGRRASTGRFRVAVGPDDDAATWAGRGTQSLGFPFPGQDFLVAVPVLNATPLDVTGGKTVVVTFEATPDGGVGPSAYPILMGTTPATPGTFGLTNVFAGPTGSLTY
jgi:hypothetical protein